MLRFFIDKPEGVTHEDCADFSREVGTILDVEDAIPGGAYTLEVSSPGLDRKLFKARDYERFQGSLVKLSTHDEVEGNRHFMGRLEKFENGRITLDQSATRRKLKKGQTAAPERVEIELSNVEKANLVPEI
jgi:ribosome maturation factor RimP